MDQIYFAEGNKMIDCGGSGGVGEGRGEAGEEDEGKTILLTQ